MEVTLAVLADYCNVSSEGKLNVMGIFDVLRSPRFPCTHPAMQLVMTFEFPSTELGRETPVEVQLIDTDGRKLWELPTTVIPTRAAAEESVEPFRVNQVVLVQNLTFQKPGDYEFAILVRGEEKRRVRLEVCRAGNNEQGA